MKQFDVTGMTCAACSARVEKAVSNVPGVSSCAVSLLTNSMSVDGNVETDEIIKAVEKAGYKACEKGSAANEDNKTSDGKKNEANEEKALVSRLICSAVLLWVLMYFSMGHTMFSLPLPSFFEGNPAGQGTVQMLIALCVMIINKRFFVNGARGVLNKAPNMDTLVAMGSGVSFAYSLIVLFLIMRCESDGNKTQAMQYLHGLYFESAAMIVTLITVGKMLEAHSKGKTTDALKGLMKLSPDEAVLLKDGEEITVKTSLIKKGDMFVVRPGAVFPADGITVKGGGAVDESVLTGESIPVEKAVGDSVSAGTVNMSGMFVCEAVSVGGDTLLAGIIKMVSDAAATKAPVAKTADKVAGVFVPSVIAIAVITFISWCLLGKDIGFAVARGISVLVISCPCALGLATPVAVMVGSGVGAKNGILFKTAASIEHAGKIKIAALDKTGTATVGKPSVTDIIPAKNVNESELLGIAYSVEYASEHPLGKAVCEKAVEQAVERREVTDFKALSGNGVVAKGQNGEIVGASMTYFKKNYKVDDKIFDIADALASEGKTPLLFSENGEFKGVIAVADTVKEDSVKAVRELRNMGVYTVMLTGDNERTANAIGQKVGVDKVIAGVLPDGKQAVIARLQKSGLTAMVGDGINDAPALTAADVGIAIGAGADIAVDAADIVLVKNSLYDAVKAVRLGRAVLGNIYQNLFWAFAYNIIGIPLAAGCFISLFGWSLNPMFGAAAMSVSSFLVVSNALRLNFKNIGSAKRDVKIKKVNIQEEISMKKTMKIEGMMCSHCEARVKKTLEAVDGVVTAVVSHEKGSAEITLSKPVADEVLVNAVTEQDYKVISIE